MDQATRKHLETWLENTVRGDIRERVRSLMLGKFGEDVEFWSGQSWPRLYDAAVSQEMFNQLVADAGLQADVDAMRGDQ